MCSMINSNALFPLSGLKIWTAVSANIVRTLGWIPSSSLKATLKRQMRKCLMRRSSPVLSMFKRCLSERISSDMVITSLALFLRKIACLLSFIRALRKRAFNKLKAMHICQTGFKEMEQYAIVSYSARVHVLVSSLSAFSMTQYARLNNSPHSMHPDPSASKKFMASITTLTSKGFTDGL